MNLSTKNALLSLVTVDQLKPLVELYKERQKRKKRWKIIIAILISFLMIWQAIAIYAVISPLAMLIIFSLICILLALFVYSLIWARQPKTAFDREIIRIASTHQLPPSQLKREIYWLFERVQDKLQPWNDIEKIKDLG